MSAAARIAKRRVDAQRLRTEGLSQRQIAAKLGVSVGTVASDLKADEPERAPVPNLQTADGKPVAGAEPFNRRAVTHGGWSEQRLGPLRVTAVELLREAYGTWLPDQRLKLIAGQVALYQSLGGVLDDMPTPIRKHRGEVSLQPAAQEFSRLAFKLERLFAELEHEQHRREHEQPSGRPLKDLTPAELAALDTGGTGDA